MAETKTWGLDGTRLPLRQLARVAYAAGPSWHDAQVLVRAVAVALAESQGFTRAWHDNFFQDGLLESRDVGVWQINIPADQVGTQTEEDLYDPAKNAAAAYKLYAARGFQPWVAYNTRVFLHDTYIQRAMLGVVNFLAEGLLADAKAAGQVPVTRLPFVSIPELRKLYPTVPGL